MLKALNHVCQKYRHTFAQYFSEEQQSYAETFNQFLFTIRSHFNAILELSNHSTLRSDSQKLIAVLLSKHTLEIYEDVNKLLLALPEKVTEWPKSKSEVFFSICAWQFEFQG